MTTSANGQRDNGSDGLELDSFLGCIETLKGDYLCGWAVARNCPKKHPIVEFFLDDVLIGWALCSVQRSDLIVAGIESGKHGFRWPLKNGIPSSRLVEITARIRDTDFFLENRIRLPAPPTISPKPELSLQQSAMDTEGIRGLVEGIKNDYVFGWVYDITAPGDSLEAVLYDGDTYICTFLANAARDDVNAGFAITGKHGFAVALPDHLYDDQIHFLRILAGDRQIPWYRTDLYPPRLVRRIHSNPPAHLRYLGSVDLVTPEQVVGWVWDRLRPETPVDLAVFADNELMGVVRANHFSRRLRSTERSGYQSFFMHFPTSAMNGSERRIKVVTVAGDFEVPNGCSPVLFPLIDYFGTQHGVPDYGIFSYSPPKLSCNGNSQTAEVLLVPEAVPELEHPLISVIVLNWNGADVLRDLLESFTRIIWRYSYELLLVDHGSVDQSIEVAESFRELLPLRILARDGNFSFSASNNYAAGLARGSYLVFANNDLVMLHDCLARMYSQLCDPNVGAVGVRLLEPLCDGPGAWTYYTHHQGIQFTVGQFSEFLTYYCPKEITDSPNTNLGLVYSLPAATGALLMCRKSEFFHIGGFQESYFYGLEDVDLCLSFQLQLNRRIICDTGSVAVHNCGATRGEKIQNDNLEKTFTDLSQKANTWLYLERYGRKLTGRILSSLIQGDSFWRSEPLRVVFVVTTTDINMAAGDFFTAMEMGESMRRLFGWEVMFACMDKYSFPGTDVAIVMRHDYEIEKITRANPGLVLVAWIRNRVDEWAEAPYFDAFHLNFCSSNKAIEYIRRTTGRNASLLPIATNPRRFLPKEHSMDFAGDVTFTGNYWGSEREALSWLNPENLDYALAIYGRGWDQATTWNEYWRGFTPYFGLVDVYSSAKIVLDDSHPVTREWNSLNSRVFDALACGRLVISNCTGGAEELFSGKLPTFSNSQKLESLIHYYLDHAEEREALAMSMRQEVLDKHTYDHRTATFKTELSRFAEKSLRFAIKIGVPHKSEREQWGDFHFAMGIKRAFELEGHFCRIDILPDWESGLGVSDDVVIVLRGLSKYKPQPTAINLMWLISHPNEVSVEECQQYDHVFVASQSFAKRLKDDLGDKVSMLLQCTNPDLFHPTLNSQIEVPKVIFVGNSRGQRREVVHYALEAGLEFSVYGGQWSAILTPDHILGDYIPNEKLRHYYSAAEVVLNDHWPDMRDEGFVSNRIFDAGACGAAIVTDDNMGCQDLFGDVLAYYRTKEELASRVGELLVDSDRRRRCGERLKEIISAQHTFTHRVEEILRIVKPISDFEPPCPSASNC